MGARDSVDDAVEFVDRHQMMTPLMVWDSTFDSWSNYEVTGQPFFVLVDSDGSELARSRELSSEIEDLIG